MHDIIARFMALCSSPPSVSHAFTLETEVYLTEELQGQTTAGKIQLWFRFGTVSLTCFSLLLLL